MPTSKLSTEELAKLEPRRMECYDCHNNVGHPFRNPADRSWTTAIAAAGSTATCRA